MKAGVALTFQAISTHSPDRAAAMATELLPLTFLAMHAKADEEGGRVSAAATVDDATLQAPKQLVVGCSHKSCDLQLTTSSEGVAWHGIEL